MIDVILLVALCVWISYSLIRDWKRLRRRAGSLLRFCALVLLLLLMLETHFLYGDAWRWLPDILLCTVGMMLSSPMVFSQSSRFRYHLYLEPPVFAWVLSLSFFPGLGSETVHLLTRLSVALSLLAFQVVYLVRWIRAQGPTRAVNPLCLAELWFRTLEIVLLLLAGFLTFLPAPWQAAPMGVLLVLQYVRCGASSVLFPFEKLSRLLDIPPDRSPTEGEEENYKTVYKKCCRFMEEKRRFLLESFSLMDLAEGVFTNKTYVSKAINQTAGLNFRQFVNRYRVQYAQELFKKNMSLRVSEMAAMSGCRSVQTFCAVFKLFTGETPRAWCNRVRKLRH